MKINISIIFRKKKENLHQLGAELLNNCSMNYLYAEYEFNWFHSGVLCNY